MDRTLAALDSPIEWQSHARTHAGLVRPFNEDAFLDSPGSGVWVVADGMGGHKAGDVASQRVVEFLGKVPASDNLNELISRGRKQLDRANAQLFSAGLQTTGQIIGCTVVALLSAGSKAAVLWAGDSRAYRLRDGHLTQMSEDHSQVNELIKQGNLSPEAAESHPNANVITRAVGVAANLDVAVTEIDVALGDVFLLCSDGLSRYISNDQIARLLQAPDCALMTAALLEAALQTPARDNITAVVMQALPRGSSTTTRLNPQVPMQQTAADDDPTMLDDTTKGRD